jgi:hypothetical protein
MQILHENIAVRKQTALTHRGRFMRIAGADTGYGSWSILGIFSLIMLVLWAKLSSVSSAANFLRQAALSGNLSRSLFKIAARCVWIHAFTSQ